MKYRKELDIISAGITDLNSRLEKLYDAVEMGKIELDDLSLCVVSESGTPGGVAIPWK